MTRVAIFDYGVGNIFSLKNALEREGASVDVITELDGAYDGLLLPGVGSFDPAMRAITRAMSREDFTNFVQENKMPVLGICLGMEVFFTESDEGGEMGLDVMNGRVESLPTSMKVPHMGWNSLQIRQDSRLIEGIKNDSWVYFVHSYMARPATTATYEKIVTAESHYSTAVPAVVEQDGYFGTQFHPEKSGRVGRRIIKNFIGICNG